ncbi:D-2-hydroxyacid dehydrogenase [Anoxynatronum buryatiense]|uniref:D-3-phosphoglycerate dehydrogenase n=1 Tax=Anoxynatronum buryatiense TaxID=489973 RepID=A0AA45WSS2_9CLOT|nr:D-2-hydroxyacid dehydrogenase [Anoxynatronum buryatiense]SMP38495.1 D-3-phosphoglycerate dehydrogenase [Anoxynatronum buryatiense]
MNNMKDTKILASDGIVKSALEKVRAMGCAVEEASYNQEELPEKLREYNGLIIRSATKITRQLLEKMGSGGKLRLIVRAGVGLDNIDLEAAKEMGITVKNTPYSSIESVAELTLAHMLSLSRHLQKSNVTMRRGEWHKKTYKGVELSGSTLGIIGFGRIGRDLAQKAHALGMKVQYNDVMGEAKDLSHFTFVDLDTLLSTSDFITLHVPKIPGEPPVLGKPAFDKIKRGAYVINCARGGLIDENALLEALNNGAISGAGLDVFEKEPPINEALLTHENVSLSPHIGASTIEAQERIGDELVSIFTEFCEGR